MFKTLRRPAALISIVCCFCLAGLAFAADLQRVEIPAGDLKAALQSLTKQTGIELVYQSEAIKGLKTKGVSGTFSPIEALTKLLEGTGLKLNTDSTGAMLIAPPQAARGSSNRVAPLAVDADASTRLAEANTSAQSPTDAQSAANLPASNSQEGEKKEALSEIVVTGTHIRGGEPVGSAVKVYSRADIEQSGAATIDQFARVMPENFSSVDSVSNQVSNANFALFNGGNVNNISAGSSFNLRGLGPSSTLTLLNGHRLAPAGLDGSLTDVSQIPLSAVDHIEVLADGASAIYGADAVAGVVNIITRKDFNGAETGVRYGTATAGGASEVLGSQLLGKSWGSGNALMSYEYDRQGGLDASQRDYIGPQGGAYTLLPYNRRNSVLLSGNQDLASDTTLTGEGIYSNRTTEYQQTNAGVGSLGTEDNSAGESLFGGTLSLNQTLSATWQLSVSAAFSKLEQTWDSVISRSNSATSTQLVNSQSSLVGTDVLANGDVFSTAAGAMKASVGASFRKETFVDHYITLQPPSDNSISLVHRNVASAYGELLLPVVGSANETFFADKLEISGAARLDHYSDFGSTTNPKVGLLWVPVSGLELRSSFGTSFRAPLLSQLHSPVSSYAFGFPDASSPTGTADTLYVYGGNPQLQAEKSHAFTGGFDLKPKFSPNFRLSVTYFHILFDNRISAPPSVGIGFLSSPITAPFVVRNPPLAEVEAAFGSPTFLGDFAGLGPGAVTALYAANTANIAATRESGVDIGSSFQVPTDFGRFNFSIAMEGLISNEFQAVSTLPAVSLVNTFAEPPKWKGRAGLAWEDRQYTAALFINYVNGYANTLFSPSQPISSWTTADLYVSYKTDHVGLPGVFQNMVVSLSVNNIADREPPYLRIPVGDILPGQNPIPFDASNASPVGRLVSIQLTKRL